VLFIDDPTSKLVTSLDLLVTLLHASSLEGTIFLGTSVAWYVAVARQEDNRLGKMVVCKFFQGGNCRYGGECVASARKFLADKQ